jgi:hypothetical protein
MAGTWFSGTQESTPTVPPWEIPIVLGGASQLEQFQQGAPQLLQLYQNMPQLQVPGIDPTQQNVLNQLVQTGQNNPELQAALAQLAQLTGGPIGSSPATQAGMQAFQQQIAPIIEQQSALRGTAGGGQAIEALGQGATSAALPLIQQEIQNRQAAVGQYGQLGQQQMQQLTTALEAAGLPREVAMQQAAALFERQQQQSKFAAGLQGFPLGMLPQLIGTTTTGTPSGYDLLSGFIKGIAPALGSAAGGAGAAGILAAL